MSTKQYPHGVKNFLEGDIDLLVDTIKLALVDSNHAFNAAHEFWSSVSANEVSDGGYTAGGQQVTTPAVTVVQSASLSAWASSTAYAVGDLVRATSDNGHVFMCVQAGTSGGSEPSWVTDRGEDTDDNTVIWTEFGAAIVKFTFDNVVWTSSTDITARHAILYKDTGTASTSPLIADDDFVTDKTASGGGTFTYTPDGDGMIVFGVGS